MKFCFPFFSPAKNKHKHKENRKFVRIPIEEYGEPIKDEENHIDEAGQSSQLSVGRGRKINIIEEVQNQQAEKDEASPQDAAQCTNSDEAAPKVAVAPTHEVQSKTVQLPRTPPTTSAEFEHAWTASNDLTYRAQLLAMVDPKALPQLLRQEFDADRLASIVEVLYQHFLPQKKPLLPILRNVAKTHRFDVSFMLLDSEVIHRTYFVLVIHFSCL